MILFRYLNREILANFFLITSILFFILMSNEFVRYLNQVAGGKFASGILWQIILLESPRFLTLLLPFSLFLAILFTYGRLYADNEIGTLSACGFGLGKLSMFSLPLILCLSLITAILNLWLIPGLSSYIARLQAQTGTAIELQMLKPGSFQQTSNGRSIIYVESISKDHKTAKNIFMAQIDLHPPPYDITPWVVLSADKGYERIDPKTKEMFLVTTNGKHYRGIPGEKEYYITQFGTYWLRMSSHIGVIDNAQTGLSSVVLWRASPHNKPVFFSELQWRIATPLSTLLLAFLAIPLSRVNPRQGKYLHLIPAITIYVLYMNLLLVGRNWIENQNISYQWGLWWIHGLLIVIILIAWCYAAGWHRIKYQLMQLTKFK